MAQAQTKDQETAKGPESTKDQEPTKQALARN
jgi:hypothetical protein